mgnify:CR=1 FL=1
MPFWGFKRLRIISTVVVLPLPVTPTKPTIALAGIVIKDPQLYQIAAGADTAKQQLEKQ